MLIEFLHTKLVHSDISLRVFTRVMLKRVAYKYVNKMCYL